MPMPYPCPSNNPTPPTSELKVPLFPNPKIGRLILHEVHTARSIEEKGGGGGGGVRAIAACASQIPLERFLAIFPALATFFGMTQALWRGRKWLEDEGNKTIGFKQSPRPTHSSGTGAGPAVVFDIGEAGTTDHEGDHGPNGLEVGGGQLGGIEGGLRDRHSMDPVVPR